MGSEMCIRDRGAAARLRDFRGRHRASGGGGRGVGGRAGLARDEDCLLYTSDAADERSSVDLGGRRII